MKFEIVVHSRTTAIHFSRDLRLQNASPFHFSLATKFQHRTPLSPFLSGFIRETGHEPIISLIAGRASDVIGERDHLSGFSNRSKRRLQELKAEVVIAKVDEK